MAVAARAGRRRDDPAAGRARGADRLRPRPARPLRPRTSRRWPSWCATRSRASRRRASTSGDRRIPIVVRFEEEDRETVDRRRASSWSTRAASGRSRSASVAAGDPRRGAERGAPGRRAPRGPGQRQHRPRARWAARWRRSRRRCAPRIDWPADMTFFIAGQNQEWERSRGSLLLALALSRLPGLRDHGRPVRVAAPAAGDHAHHPAGLRRHRGDALGSWGSASRWWSSWA